jgi:phosphocarrier protein FPr
MGSVILVVDELDVATAASVDPEQVAGIVVVARGRTGHGAIVAGSRASHCSPGGSGRRRYSERPLVAFDARRGRLWTAVSDEQGPPVARVRR